VRWRSQVAILSGGLFAILFLLSVALLKMAADR
jgi:hypothetical protein